MICYNKPYVSEVRLAHAPRFAAALSAGLSVRLWKVGALLITNGAATTVVLPRETTHPPRHEREQHEESHGWREQLKLQAHD